jgi:glycosyltransferase involved in cell wall biosynthesis
VAAFSAFRQRFPAARLDIVGDGPQRESIEKIARSIGIIDAVSFLGYVKNDDVPSVLSEAGVLVLPSFSEALGQVLLEAMAAGRPVIGSNVGGIAEVIRDGDNGLLVDPSRPESLTAALCKLAENWSNAIRMGERGRRTAFEYTPTTMNRRWQEAVELVLGRISRNVVVAG